MVSDTKLDDLTESQLRALAAARKVKLPAKHLPKAKLVALLRAAKEKG